ncbi:Bcr/CflA family efflux MFS transporter [Salmonella enterica subsp. enterica serovar Enteritidis]|nr:Bcr/CflA family efflux MFS transporter [Salmonella enterica subsp. enterica serovar Enteritidis]
MSAIGGLLAAIGPISMALYTPAMPDIVDAFGTTEAAVKMSLSLYFGGFAFAQLICGPLSDGLGRRSVTVGFMLVYTLASFVALLAPIVETLIAARFAQGIGAAAGIAISRALVRDLFSGEQSARILNMNGIILAVGPAISPTIGGLILHYFGWHQIFFAMAGFGMAVAATAIFAMKETVPRDLSRIRPGALVKSYRTLLSSRQFMAASLTNAGAPGALYALATMLPFVMMKRVGLTPTQFGFAMLMQSLSFLGGSLVMRRLMRRYRADAMTPVGLALIALASISLAVLMRTVEPNLYTVMVPVALYAAGIGFVMSPMTTAALAPFPAMAGAASALFGFMQMGMGLAGGVLAASMGDAALAVGTIIPALGALSVISWLVWRSLPEHRTGKAKDVIVEPIE